MGNFRSNDRGPRRDSFRGSSGGFNRGRGGFGGDRGGFGRDRGRRPLEMHDAVCDKCKQECQVPFRPTPGKPVLCSDCFKSGGSSSSSPRQDRGSSFQSPSQSGISSDQFKQLNIKLDKIINILEDLEIVEDDEDFGDDEEDGEESNKPIVVVEDEGEDEEDEDESEGDDEDEEEVESEELVKEE